MLGDCFNKSFAKGNLQDLSSIQRAVKSFEQLCFFFLFHFVFDTRSYFVKLCPGNLCRPCCFKVGVILPASTSLVMGLKVCDATLRSKKQFITLKLKQFNDCSITFKMSLKWPHLHLLNVSCSVFKFLYYLHISD